MISQSNVSISAVKAELGASTNSLASLCTSSSINKWAKSKPFRSSGTYQSFSSLRSAIESANYGLSWNGGTTEAAFTYNRPRGGSSEPYRLGDFRGYDHPCIPFCLGGALTPVRIDLSNYGGSQTIRTNNDENAVSWWDLRRLFSSYPYLYLSARMYFSQTNVGSILINLTRINLNSYTSSPVWSIPNRMFLKLGKTESIADAFCQLGNGSSFINFTFQQKLTFISAFKVGDINSDSWAWNSSADTPKLGNYIRSTTGYELESFKYWMGLSSGNPRYLDLRDSEYLFVDTYTMSATSSYPLNQNNMRLRITQWTTQRHYLLPLYEGERLVNWTIDDNKDAPYSNLLGNRAQYLPNFGSDMFGFSLVYYIDSSTFIPLTKERFARVRFPSTNIQPVSIF